MHGEPLIRHVLRRAEATGYDLVVATSLNERDDLLANVVRDYGFKVFRGSEWDVLSRMAGAANAMLAETIVRMTADCPLWAPDICQRVLNYYVETGERGIVTNDTTVSGWADGLDVEVFSNEMLQRAARYATDRTDREHVTPWMRRHAEHKIYGSTEDWRTVKISVDTYDDFERARTVLAKVDGYEWAATRSALLGLNYQAAGGATS